MKKNLFHVFFLISCLQASAQDLSSLEPKRPITENDHADLLNRLYRSFEPEGSVIYQMTNKNLFEKMQIPPVKKTTPEELAALEKKLKETPENIDLMIRVASAYAEMNRPVNSQKLFYKALEAIAKASKKTPDDAGLYQKAGMVYTALGNYEMMIMSYEKCLKLDPARDTVANVFLPVSYLGAGFYLRLNEYCKEKLSEQKNDVLIHLYYLISPLMQNMISGFDFGPYTAEQYFESFSIYQVVDSSFLNAELKKDPESVVWNQLMHGSEMYGLLFRYYSTFNLEKKSATVSEKSLKEIAGHRDYYSAVIRKKKTENPFLAHLSLGLLELFENHPKDAIPHLERAIKSYPAEYFEAQSNSAVAYDNLNFAYLLLGDTTKAEQTLDRKIQAVPELFTNPDDLYLKACYRLYHRDRDAVLKNADAILLTDSTYKKAKILKAVLYIESKEYAKAMMELEESYSEFKYDFSWNFTYAILLMLKNDPSTAKAFLRQVIAIAPENKSVNRLIEDYFKSP